MEYDDVFPFDEDIDELDSQICPNCDNFNYSADPDMLCPTCRTFFILFSLLHSQALKPSNNAGFNSSQSQFIPFFRPQQK